MKLTKEQKYNNSTIKTGTRILQNKLIKLEEDIAFEEETMRLNSNNTNTELGTARVIVAKDRLVILNGMVKQLNSCINILESSLIK